MAYIDGFIIAVPNENKDKFRAQAQATDSVFLEHGAVRVVECWGDEVPEGKVTDFRRAVKAEEDETVVFSWVEWPDKPTRDAAMSQVMSDPRMQPGASPMSFDAQRMIYGGFEPIVELG